MANVLERIETLPPEVRNKVLRVWLASSTDCRGIIKQCITSRALTDRCAQTPAIVQKLLQVTRGFANALDQAMDHIQDIVRHVFHIPHGEYYNVYHALGGGAAFNLYEARLANIRQANNPTYQELYNWCRYFNTVGERFIAMMEGLSQDPPAPQRPHQQSWRRVHKITTCMLDPSYLRL